MKVLFSMIFMCLKEMVYAQYTKNSLLPKSYDASVGWEYCLGYSVIRDQLNCSSCCSAAIASALSARDCMRDGRNVLYSSKQIWDCTYIQNITSCNYGTYFHETISRMSPGESYNGFLTLVPEQCSPDVSTPLEPSLDRCLATWSSRGNESECKDIAAGDKFLYSSVYANELLLGLRGQGTQYNAFVSSNTLMSEIVTNGPVVAVLYISKRDFQFFSNLSSSSIFIPDFNYSKNLPENQMMRHCIMVYGWGKDNISGLEYWLVQNSYGDKWSNNGRGRIIKGYNWLENEWRGLSTNQRSCYTAPLSNRSCIPIEQYNFSRIQNQLQLVSDTASFDYLMNMLPVLFDKFLLKELHYNELDIDKYQMGEIVGLSNGEIVAITFTCSLIIVFLSFLFVNYYTRKQYQENVSIPYSLDAISKQQAVRFIDSLTKN